MKLLIKSSHNEGNLNDFIIIWGILNTKKINKEKP